MYGDGLAEAAHTTDLDVDDAAGLHVDGSERVAAIADGFVETDSGLEALLQHGMEVEVVVPERLLDHEQIELVPGRRCGRSLSSGRRNWRRSLAVMSGQRARTASKMLVSQPGLHFSLMRW